MRNQTVKSNLNCLYVKIPGMERAREVPPHIEHRGNTMQPPTFKEWLHAVLWLPVTLQRLTGELGKLNRNLADLIEVCQDFNEGFYGLFGGRVTYTEHRVPDQRRETKQ